MFSILESHLSFKMFILKLYLSFHNCSFHFILKEILGLKVLGPSQLENVFKVSWNCISWIKLLLLNTFVYNKGK